MAEIVPLSGNNALVEPETGRQTQQARNFFNSLALLSVLEGSGSPEGVVQAKATRLYMDTAGTAGSILYIKQVDSLAGDNKSGWVLI